MTDEQTTFDPHAATAADLPGLDYPQLQAVARVHEVPATGKRDELEAAVAEALSPSSEGDSGAQDDPDAEKAPEGPDDAEGAQGGQDGAEDDAQDEAGDPEGVQTWRVTGSAVMTRDGRETIPVGGTFEAPASDPRTKGAVLVDESAPADVTDALDQITTS